VGLGVNVGNLVASDVAVRVGVDVSGIAVGSGRDEQPSTILISTNAMANV
jgi:hypothetical protein